MGHVLTEPRQPGQAIPHVRVAVTVDLHDGDVPSDITLAASWLNDAGIPATFLVPSSLFAQKQYTEPLRELHAFGHEVGSHTHRHDVAETEALYRGDRRQLEFLSVSKRAFEDFYGLSPRSFRAPGWSVLGPAALDELDRLGYLVDSSATPQRLSLLSSYPYRRAWTFAPRRVRRLRSGLLEVPSSTLLVPAGSPSFQLLRQQASVAFVWLLVAEAMRFDRRAVVLQFHPNDFNPNSAHAASCGRPKLIHFWPRRQGGFFIKHFMMCKDRKRVNQTTQAIMRLVATFGCETLTSIAAAFDVGTRDIGCRHASADGTAPKTGADLADG